MDVSNVSYDRFSPDNSSNRSSSESRLSALDNLDWYHGGISRHIAESLLLNNGKEGSFLLRDKTNGVEGNDFVLSVRSKDAVNHYEAKWDGNKYVFGFGSFKTLQEFHDHLMTQTLLAGENGVLVVLKYPYPREVEEPSVYDSVRIHASMGRNRSVVEPQHLANASKEGYLTKQGGFIKTWKTRWFTLKGTALKYFKDRRDKEPLRVLDLGDCTDCWEDNSVKEREHCFRLDFPWRSFYFCASTHQECQEWITLIQWKLNSLKNS